MGLFAGIAFLLAFALFMAAPFMYTAFYVVMGMLSLLIGLYIVCEGL